MQANRQCLGRAAGYQSNVQLLHSQKRLTPIVQSAATVLNSPSEQASTSQSLQDAKAELFERIRYTSRGMGVQRYQRGLIEEAQVAVENFGGEVLDYNLLPGMWKLMYTTASDVLPILEIESRLGNPFGPAPLQVGNIYQRFSSVEEGVVENLIQFGVPFLLEGKNGVTFTVGARYTVRSGKRIALTFEEARVGAVRISDGLEALIAPAMLPRGALQHAVLLAIKQFQVRVPFRSAQQLSNAATARQSIAANYLLTYLDEDMLIGRATGLQGSFIFMRETEDQHA